MDATAIMNASAAGRNAMSATGIEPTGDRTKMRKAAQEFEAQFLGQMFQLAMKDAPVDEVFGGGPGERMFRDLLTNSWADETSRSGGVGIADAVMESLIRIQGELAK